MLVLGQAWMVMTTVTSGHPRAHQHSGHHAVALEQKIYQDPATVPMPSEKEDDSTLATTPVNRRKRRGVPMQLREHKRRRAPAHPIKADLNSSHSVADCWMCDWPSLTFTFRFNYVNEPRLYTGSTRNSIWRFTSSSGVPISAIGTVLPVHSGDSFFYEECAVLYRQVRHPIALYDQ